MGGGCQNKTALSVEYCEEGSKDVLKFLPTMSPPGTTRVRENDANPNPWFLASGRFRVLVGTRENLI